MGKKGWKGQRKKEERISFGFWAIKQTTKREPQIAEKNYTLKHYYYINY